MNARKTWREICQALNLSRWPLTEHEHMAAAVIIARAVVDAQEVVLRARANAHEPLGLLRLIVAEALGNPADEYASVPTAYVREAARICGLIPPRTHEPVSVCDTCYGAGCPLCRPDDAP